MTNDEFNNRFNHHAPDKAAILQHEGFRDEVKELAKHIEAALPEGREKSLALTKLEEVMFWGNAAIARQEK